MRKISLRILLLILAGNLLLSSFAVNAHTKKPVIPGSNPANPIPVIVARVTQQAIPQQVDALGSLKALQSVVVSSEVSGRVSQIFFSDGQHVDQLQADVGSQEAAVKSAMAVLNEKQLTAPFNGTLTAFQVQVGDYVNQGQPLVTLVNREQLEVVYSLPEQYLPDLKMGQVVAVTSNAYPNKSFQGAVTYVAPNIDETTRSIGIQATIDNKEGLLSPGLFVHVTQTIGMDNNSLVIPEEAVMASVKGYTVYKVVNGQVRLTTVQLGVHSAGKVQVVSGLSLNDDVVVAGQQKLQDGSYVTVTTQ